MSGAKTFLLDTNVVLHATREKSAVGSAIDAQFGLSASRFRPAICEVTVAELTAFALAGWGEKRIALLKREIKRCLVIPISTPGVHERWAEIQSVAKKNGVVIGHNDLWIAAVAFVAGFTVLTTDGDFGKLRRLGLVDAILLNAQTGARLI